MHVDTGDFEARKLGGQRIDSRARLIGMPNLFSALPVAILAWVLASMSGLTRTRYVAARSLPVAIDESSSSSARIRH